MIRDGQMPGSWITILEEQQLLGGALDGIEEPDKGFVIRSGREMEEHFECLWDLCRSIPSLEIEGASVILCAPLRRDPRMDFVGPPRFATIP